MSNFWPLYMSLLGMASLLIWMLVDASFCLMVEELLIQLGIKSDLGMGIKGVMPPISLGVRIMVFASLVTSTSACYAVSCWMAITTKRGADLKGLLLLVSVACIASFVLSQWEAIAWTGFRFRISCRARIITKDCKTLLETWPARKKLVTSLGLLSPPSDPHASLLDEHLTELAYCFRDQFGPLVFRQENRVIVEVLGSPFWKLEYIEDSEAPKDFHNDFDGWIIWYTLIETKQISSQLYLSRYQPGCPDAMQEENSTSTPAYS